MKKFLQLLLAASLCTTPMVRAKQSVLSKVYCYVLGNQDVQQEYKDQTRQALQTMDVKNPEDVTVKQMNGVGPAFARFNLSSFTAFGIWLDEAYLASTSKEEQTFHIYHEAAHYQQKHHQKNLAACTVGIAGGLVLLNQSLSIASPIAKAAAVTGSAAAIGSYFYLLPHFIKQQEKQADIIAAQALLKAGNRHVVQARIDDLQNNCPEDSSLWWLSSQEQVNYLQRVLRGCPKRRR